MLKITEPLLQRNERRSRGAKAARYIDESSEIVMDENMENHSSPEGDAAVDFAADDEIDYKDTPFETGQIVKVFVQDFMCHRKFTVSFLLF